MKWLFLLCIAIAYYYYYGIVLYCKYDNVKHDKNWSLATNPKETQTKPHIWIWIWSPLLWSLWQVIVLEWFHPPQNSAFMYSLQASLFLNERYYITFCITRSLFVIIIILIPISILIPIWQAWNTDTDSTWLCCQQPNPALWSGKK